MTRQTDLLTLPLMRTQQALIQHGMVLLALLCVLALCGTQAFATNQAPPGVTAVNDAYSMLEDSVLNQLVPGVLANDSSGEGYPLTVTPQAHDTAHGHLLLRSNGSFVYNPSVNFTGEDSFVYTVSDGNGGSATATVTITVNPINDPPFFTKGADQTVLENASAVTVADWAYDISPGAYNEYGQTLTFHLSNNNPDLFAVAPAISSTGTLTFTPAGNLVGSATVTVYLTDDAGTANGGNDTSGSTTFTITVDAVNGSPTFDVIADQAVDEDAAEQTVSITSVSPGGGPDEAGQTVTFSATSSDTSIVPDPSFSGTGETRTLHFTPVANAFGTVTITVTATDDGGTENGGIDTFSRTFKITVNAVNDAPTAGDSTATTDEDTSVTVDVLALCDDVANEEQTLTITGVTDGAHGSVTNNGDGTVTYSPDDDYFGADSFTYTVSDGELTATGTITVTVNAVNDAPTAGDSTATTDEDTSVTVDVLALCDDLANEEQTLTITGVTDGAHGSVTNNGDGTVKYTPASDWYGEDSFTYTVSDGELTATGTITVTVGAVNDAPVALDDTVETTENTAVDVDVLALCSDVDNTLAATSITGVTDGANGTVVNNEDGTVTYTPATDWYGEDSFTYTVSDGDLTATGTITVTVHMVNHAPSFTKGDDQTVEEDCGDQTIAGWATNISPGPESESGQSLTFHITTSDDTLFSSLPYVDSFSGDLSFTPANNAFGTATITVTLQDDGGTEYAGNDTSASQTFVITVTPVNDPPTASDGTAETDEDLPVTVNVLALASDQANEEQILLITGVTNGTHGAVLDNGDGTVTYTPDPDYFGEDDFSYTVSDGELSATGTIYVTINAVNDQPTAADGTATTDEDIPVTVNVLDLCGDVDNILTGASIISATLAVNGAVVNNEDGTITFTPDENFNGTGSFKYQVTDGEWIAEGTITVTVNAVNDAPTAADSTLTTDEDTPASKDVLALCDDVANEEQTLTITGVTDGAHGTVTNNGDGTVTYSPDDDYFGADSFTYTVSDGELTATGTITVTVNAVNDAPTAADSTLTTDEDTPASKDVLALCDDVANEEQTLTITGVTDGAHGTVTNNGDGTVTYSPDDDYFGADSFTYTVSDGELTATGTITVTVNSINDAPTAGDSTVKTNEDTPKSVDVLALCADVANEEQTLTITGVTDGAHGTVTNNGDGTVTYSPDDDYFGADSFTYTVSDGELTATGTITVTVNAVNDAPTAADSTLTTDEDTPASKDVLALCDDVANEEQTLTITGVTDGAHGSVTNNGDGTVTYTPATDWYGEDSFTYTVSDGELTATGTITVTVNPINDAPIANDGTVDTYEDHAIDIDLLALCSDVDEDTLSITFVSGAAHGDVFDNFDGTATYVPDEDWYGEDSFTFTVSDGEYSDSATVTVHVDWVNTEPSYLRGADQVIDEDAGPQSVTNWATLIKPGPADEDWQTLEFWVSNDKTELFEEQPAISPTGTLTYKTAANAFGLVTVTVRLHDNGGTTHNGFDTSEPETFTITVNSVNDAPVAGDGTATTAEDTSVDIDVMDLVTDVDNGNDVIAVTAVTNGTHGTVTDNEDGTVTYSPDDDYFGTDSFTYTISDGEFTSTGTITVTVTPVNDPPTAENASVNTDEDTPVEVNVLLLCGDVANEEETLVITGVTDGTYGTVMDNGNGTVTYSPDQNFTGKDSFTYTVSDGELTATGIITVSVFPINDGPTAQDGTVTTDEDTPATVDVLALCADVDNTLTGASITAVTDGTHGTVTNNEDGTVTYSPDDDYFGTDSFTYTISDGELTATGTITVTVAPINDLPVASDSTATTQEDTSVSVNVLALCSDVANEEQTLTITGVTDGENGTVTDNGDGTVTYSPDEDYFGEDSFTYTVSDGELTATGTITVTVNAVNDAPIALDGTATTDEDVPVTVDVLALCSDVDNQESLTIQGATLAVNGAVVNNEDGTVTFTPDQDFNGTASFKYQVNDGEWIAEGTITVTVNPVNDPPTVIITAPEDGDEFDAGSDITLTAEVTDIDSGAAQVAFYDENDDLIGLLTTEPFTFVWNNVPPGEHTIYAVAWDDDPFFPLESDPSDAVTINVYDVPATVRITSPANDSAFFVGTDLTITAEVTKPGGAAFHVRFYRDDHILLGIDRDAPFSIDWRGLTAGTHTLTAEVDDGETTVTSDPITIIVSGDTYLMDLAIRNQDESTYAGENIQNNDELQTKAQTVATGVPATFFLKLKNTGNVADTFVLTGAASGTGWTASYFQGETEITGAVVDGGWSDAGASLAVGDQREVRVQITLDASLAGADAITVPITVTSGHDNTQSDTVIASVTKAALTEVTLTTSLAAPRTIDVPITLTAVANGGGNLEYAFDVSTDGGENWTPLTTGYGASNTFIWTPSATGTYALRVMARENAGTPGAEVSKTLFDYQIVAKISSVTLDVAPTSPTALGITSTLTATVVGGAHVKYWFRVQRGTVWTDLQTYATSNTCTFTPTLASAYTLQVLVRDDDSGKVYDQHVTKVYYVNAAIRTLRLSANIVSPTSVGTPVALTATAVGGGTLRYAFRVWDGTDWSDLRSYGTGNTLSWVPGAAGDYLLEVWAKEVGSSQPYDKSATLAFHVEPAISAISLTATPVNVTAVGTPITLTATPTGGANVRYWFRMLSGGTATDLQAYSASNVCTFVPTTTGSFTLQVLAKENGSLLTSQVYAVIPYTVKSALSAVSLATSVVSPTAVGITVNLTATATGGASVRYLFRVFDGEEWTVLANPTADFGTSRYCPWRPTTPGIYVVEVQAREVGSSRLYDVAKSKLFVVNPALSALALTSSTSSSFAKGTTAVLTATPTNGGTLLYWFRVSADGGRTWTELRAPAGYSATNTCSWTPTVTGTYLLQVMAKEAGSTRTYDLFKMVSLTVTP